MKILLVTIIDNNNIGTALQVYATVHLLEKRGHEVVVLDYIRDYLFGRKYALDLWKNRNWIVRNLFSFYYAWINRNKRFAVKDFLAKNQVSFTRTYYSSNDIKIEQCSYDLYLTGSDQVWNIMHNNNHFDDVYFLAFSEGKKIAFSASIGTDSFPNDNVEVIRELLSKYKYISVRETDAIRVLKGIGINNVTHVLDPTLVFPEDYWMKKFHSGSFVKKEPYLLIYSVEENDSLVKHVAKYIAGKKNLSIYQVSSSSIKHKDGVKCCFNDTPPELFLQLVHNADYMVVSSFHGTAFSINFNKQFVTIAPNRFNSRVLSLLKMFGLEDRYVSCEDNIDIESINYDRVNVILEHQRAVTIDFIDKALNIR